MKLTHLIAIIILQSANTNVNVKAIANVNASVIENTHHRSDQSDIIKHFDFQSCPAKQLILPKTVSFQQWKKKTNKRPNQTSQQQQQAPTPRLTQQPLNSHQLTHLSFPQESCNPLDQPLQNISHQTIHPPSYPQNTSLNLQNSFDIIYQPHPNTGTGTPDDPLDSLSTRTNYASVDCSASIHRSSKRSKSPSAILNEKKDKYMLTPCANNKPTRDTTSYQQSSNFVVFELCDEIEIDSVVLANFEFFSSMFKIIRMSVSNSGLEGVNGAEWVHVGYLKTHNIRGFQVFSIKHLKGFYRYVRLDFLTHYGSEYYCPLSLVRIYGLTQIDAYRRDAKLEERSKVHVEEQVEEEDDDHDHDQEEEMESQDELEQDDQLTAESLSHSSLDHLESVHPIYLDQNQETFEHEHDLQSSLNAAHSPDSVLPPPLTVQKNSSDNYYDPKLNNINEAEKIDAPAEKNDPVKVQDLIESSTDTNHTPESSLPELPVHNTPAYNQEPQQDHQASKIIKANFNQVSSSKDNLQSQPASQIESSSTPEVNSKSNSPPYNSQFQEDTIIVEPTDDPVVAQDEPSDSSASSSSREENSKKATSSSSDPLPSQKHSSPKMIQSNEKLQPNFNLPPPTGSNPNSQGTESIFGQIMKRLNFLESNHHLLLNYLEEQVLVLESSGNRLRKKLVEFDHLLKIQIKKQEENRREIKKIKNEIISIESFINKRLESLESTIIFIKRFGLILFLSILSILIFLGLARTSTSTLPTILATTRANNHNRRKSHLRGSKVITENDFSSIGGRGTVGNSNRKNSTTTAPRSFIRSNYFPSSSSPNREFIVSSPTRNKTYSSRSPQHSYKINSSSSPVLSSFSSNSIKKASSPPIFIKKSHSNSRKNSIDKIKYVPNQLISSTHNPKNDLITQKAEEFIIDNECSNYMKMNESEVKPEESTALDTNSIAFPPNLFSEENVPIRTDDDDKKTRENKG